jgi:hypothetical protein
MLVKLAKVRSKLPLADAVDCAQTAGRKYIAAASHVLPHCRMMHESVGPMLGLAPGAPALTAINGGKLNGTLG